MTDNSPSNETIKHQIKNEIEFAQLSDTQLEQLLQLQIDTPPVRQKTQHNPFMMVAACMLIFVLGVSTAVFLPSEHDGSFGTANNDIINAIAAEVVDNHLKLKPLDIETNSITDTRRFLDQLDFSPIHSTNAEQRFGLQSQRLTGGRYCSIQGTTAAQLRYRDRGQLQTLYQVPYDSQRYGSVPALLNDELPITVDVKGLRVRLWIERDLLMVLVSP